MQQFNHRMATDMFTVATWLALACSVQAEVDGAILHEANFRVATETEERCGPCVSLLPAGCENPGDRIWRDAADGVDEVLCDCADVAGGATAFEPRWTVRAGAIVLDRSAPTGARYLFSTVNNTELLRPSDFNFETTAGYEVAARRRFAGGWSADFRWFDLGNDAEAVTPITGSVGIGFVGTNIADRGTTLYRSRLQSAEGNLVGDTDTWWKPLVGFRYLKLSDDLNTAFTGSGPFTYFSFFDKTDNRLLGGQVGFEGTLWQRERFTIDMWLKAGVYANELDRTAGRYSNGAVLGNVLGAGDEITSFVGDLAFHAHYRWTEHVALRAGYQLLWLDGIAEAANQGIDAADTGINHDGHPFFHGATAGLEFTW
jgi:hypothetical protein